MLKKTIGITVLLAVIFLSGFSPAHATTDGKPATDPKNFPSLLGNSSESPFLHHESDSLYNLMGLGSFGLEKEVFYTAFKGYEYLLSTGQIRKKNLLTICDYSQSSHNKRLYVIDLKEARLVFNTFVSHGKNSGGEFATSFSNLKSSNKSSLGFLLTGETYRGVAGYSMRFDGLEAGINDKVRSRDIVLHGSKFVNAQRVEERGMIGNSLGCPAVPVAQHKQIIDLIKGGSCFFINHPDSWYATNSAIVNSKFDLLPEVLNNTATANAPATGTVTAAAATTTGGGL